MFIQIAQFVHGLFIFLRKTLSILLNFLKIPQISGFCDMIAATSTDTKEHTI